MLYSPSLESHMPGIQSLTNESIAAQVLIMGVTLSASK